MERGTGSRGAAAAVQVAAVAQIQCFAQALPQAGGAAAAAEVAAVGQIQCFPQTLPQAVGKAKKRKKKRVLQKVIG